MHRFYVDRPILAAGDEALLSREESRHAARVLRLSPGQEIMLLDGAGLWTAELVAVDERGCLARALAPCPSPEPDARVTLVQGLPKAEKLEWIAQKATELGAWALWPVEMERSVARADKEDRAEKRRGRLARIALEAAKQSGRAHVTEIEPVVCFEHAVKRLRLDRRDLLLVAWEEERAMPMSQAVRAHVERFGAPASVAVVVGPEGGVTRGEWQSLRDAGAVSVSLGRRILRTETAALCALSVLWAVLGDM